MVFALSPHTQDKLKQEGKELLVVLRELVGKQREDVRKQICSAKEAMYILGMSQNTFYDHLKHPDCLIQPSTKKGSYVLKSVYDEAKRLNNGYELL